MSLEQLMALARQLNEQAPMPRAPGRPPLAAWLRPRSTTLSPEEWAGLFPEPPSPALRPLPPA